MLFTYAGTLLGDGTIDKPSRGAQGAGSGVVDVVQLFRTATSTAYGLGNRVETITFTVTRDLSTQKDAELYWATHYGSLPDSGDLVLTCGATGDTATATMTGAVLVSVQKAPPVGVSITHTYTFKGPPPA